MNKRKKLLSFFILVIVNIWEQAASAQNYIVEQGSPVKVNISAKGVNRIAIENDRIAQVIGNEDEYFVESDANLGQIYLTSALKTPAEITIRFLTEREKIIDAKLIVNQIDPQTIVFKYKGEEGSKLSNLNGPDALKISTITASSANSYEYKLNSSSNNDNTQQVIDLIKLVHNNKDIKGTEIQTLNCLKNNPHLKDIKFLRADSYEIKKHNVIKAIIQNKSKNIISLNEEEFVGCMKSVNAIALDKDTLASKESANLYLVGNYEK